MLTDQNETWRPNFLVVDDDPIVRKLVSHGLGSLGAASIVEVEDGLAAQAALRANTFDVVVTDVLMPGLNGLDLMKWAQENHPGPLWIVLSSLDTFDAAVEALHLGAFDYLAKPPEVRRVELAVRHALDQLALVRDRQRLYDELESSHDKLAEKVQQLEGLCSMLEDQARVIRSDLTRAEVIQRALLPQVPPQLGDWSIETLYRPGSNVGGDYYDLIRLDPDHLGIVIADAAGHGVAAAMLSVLFKHRLTPLDEQEKPLSPSQVLEHVNENLHEDMAAPGMFITAVYGLLDLRTGQLEIASAGHPPVICAGRDGKTRSIARTGPALGLRDQAEYGQESLALDSGDRLLLYTDGVIEGGSESPDLQELANGLGRYDEDRGTLLGGFHASATAGLGDDRDDITMVLIERSAGPSRFDVASEPRTQPETSGRPAPTAECLQATSSGEGFISIAGDATWTRAAVFYDVATRMAKSRSALTLDLEGCDYMDSTFLGTLHEAVMSGPDRTCIQNVSPKVRALFEELDMKGVLERISANSRPLPSRMEPMRRADKDVTEQGLRVLRAHEILSSLSDENQAQFRSVVESLRADLDESLLG